MRTINVHGDEEEQVQETVRQAAEVFTSSGLVIFPTETVYGLGASALSDAGYAALRAVKGRPDAQPLTVHIPNAAAADKYADLSHPTLRRFVRKVFPGPVTLVVDVNEETIRAKLEALGGPPDLRERLYHQNTVGLRCPDHPLGQQVLGAVDAPIVASSANKRGDPPPQDVDQAAAAVGEFARLVVDGGPCRYAKPSTIVRIQLAGNQPKLSVQRPGVYDERVIRKLLRWTMLLVCSGNTCRSPMAEGLARQMLAQARNLPLADLEAAGVRVVSAGAFATAGAPATPEAVEALAKFGVDLTRHRSRPLTPQLIQEADVVYCMTAGHQRAVLDLVPAAADKVLPLDPNGDIDDPLGSSPTVYQRCAEVIRRRLEQRLKEQQP